MTDSSDKELILALQDGSLDALGVLYDRYRQLVYRTALAIVGDTEAASDLLQDVFLRLHRFADRIDPQRPIEPWLYRMTANLSYTWVKRRNRWIRPLEDLAEWIAGAHRNFPYEQAERNDEWEQVQKAVSALPLPQRVVVVLYYLNDLSLQEIAEILDVPVGTVKSRLHYGRQTLKKSLKLSGEGLPDFNYKST
ncbi:MAG TPA: sigma-70 family RNA polymerase sigma factor [Anaerolineales bacterium]|nr:sigma-70 family RNA polymerase sigma factor [Anaerolineales bacterium]